MEIKHRTQEPREELEHHCSLSILHSETSQSGKKSYCKTKGICRNPDGVPLLTPDTMCEWRTCTGLFKGLQKELILKYLHKSTMRDSHLCPSRSGCAVLGIHTPMEEARTNGWFGWACSGTELKKNSDRQNNPDLDNEDKISSIQQSRLQLHLPNPQLI